MDICPDPPTSHLPSASHQIANLRDSGNRAKNNKRSQVEPKTCAQEIKTVPCSTRLTNMTRRTDHSSGMGPEKRRKRKREDEKNSSEGVQIDVHEDTHISTTEGAVLLKPTLTDGFLKANAPSLQQDASKDLMRMSRSLRARKTKTNNKSGLKQKVNKRTSVLDVTDKSTHRYS